MSEWISIEDEWPKDFSDVWVTNGQQTHVANVKNVVGGLSCVILGNPVAVVMNVTHWMPLVPPKPPEPQLTVKEALREAVDLIETHMSNHASEDIMNAMYFALPRLRAALEAERC